MATMNACCYCGTTDDLRPYGPNCAWVCYDCAMSTPERKAQAEAAIDAQLAVIYGPVVIGEEIGPYPLANNPTLCAAINDSKPTDNLVIWTIYRRPRDYPTTNFVARKWEIVGLHPIRTDEVMLADTLAEIRQCIPPGLVCFPRDRRDDPAVVESWL